MKDYIQLEKDNILRLGIKDSEGKDTGEFLEFDLEDIELPIKYQEMERKIWTLKKNFQMQLQIIEKKQDHKSKRPLSANEEALMRLYRDFIKDMADAYDMFLGKGGVKKLLNSKNLQWTSLNTIDNIIEKQILPHLDVKMENIEEKIKKIYGETNDKDVLE